MRSKFGDKIVMKSTVCYIFLNDSITHCSNLVYIYSISNK